MSNNFGIHNHTEFSNIKVIDSINRADRMIDYAWEIGMSGLAFTDHDCVSGALKFLKAYKKKLEKEWSKLHPDQELPSYEEMSKELDFKVVLGNEIYLSEEGLTEANMNGVDPCHFWHYILIAKDEIGFKQIKQLSSAAWRRAWFRNILRTPTYPSDLLTFIEGGHVIASTACLGGYTAWCWRQAYHNDSLLSAEPGQKQDAIFYLNKLDNHLMAMENLFGKGNFFIELQPNAGIFGQEQIEYNKFMIERYWSKYPFVFSTDAHYLKAEEREIHKAFLNSKSSKDREVDEFYRYAYIMSQDEIRSLMPYVNDEMFMEMVNNTRKIKEMCSFYELSQKQIVTKVQYEHAAEYEEDLEIFNDVDQSYPNFYYFLHSNNETDRYLAKLVAHGFVEKYKDSWNTDVYYRRLEEEFWTIKEVSERMGQNMADYFISMAKMIDIMWNEAGSLVGPSRGSAGALLINYLLGITQMDPVEMELPFVWRFLHPSRPDMPD